MKKVLYLPLVLLGMSLIDAAVVESVPFAVALSATEQGSAKQDVQQLQRLEAEAFFKLQEAQEDELAGKITPSALQSIKDQYARAQEALEQALGGCKAF
jgi:hypothetical protein